MKKLTLTIIVAAGLSASALAQGIVIANSANSGPSSAATSGGLVWINSGGISLFDGATYNVGIQVLAGATSSSLSPLATIYPGLGGTVFTGLGAGQFAQDPAVTYNTGVTPGNLAWVQLQMWTWDTPGASGATTYAAATGLSDYRGTVLFQNPTSGGTPPAPDQLLSGMPALILNPVPEPTTIALAGLGLASLLIFRRRQ